MRSALKNAVIAVIVIIIAVIYSVVEFMPNGTEGKLAVVFIDVGDADCALIKTPQGKAALIDGGNPWNLREIHNVLNKYDVKKIDYMINSHPHEDHIGSFYKLMDLYETGAVYMPETEFENESLELFNKKLSEHNIPLNYVKRGDIILDEDVKIEVLSPFRDYFKEENDYSAVYLLSYKEKTFLFMGDMGSYFSNSLIVYYGLSECDVLKVSHHGSEESTSNYFLYELSPDYAVVSCSDEVENRPSKRMISAFNKIGTEYYATKDSGNITMITDGENIEVKTERKKK